MTQHATRALTNTCSNVQHGASNALIFRPGCFSMRTTLLAGYPACRRASAWLSLSLVAGALAACAGDLESETLPELLVEATDLDLPGIVIMVDGPGTDADFAGAAGMADVAGGVPMTVDVGFRIASNTKTFVGLALTSMEVDGLVDLDAPLAELLDSADLQGIRNAEDATLRQALQHTSGIVDYLDGDGFWAAVEQRPTTPWTVRDALAFARNQPPYFRVGDGWEYSNTNYLLAGLVIERAGGTTWARVVRQRVLDPLGMTDSFVENGEEARVAIAHGYSEGTRDMYAYDTGYGLPDGGIVATAPELSTFIRAVGGGAIPDGLSPEAVAALLTNAPNSEGDERYGLGLAEYSTPCGRTIGHGGGLEGYLSEMFYVPDRDLSIVIFVNASDGWVDDEFDAVLERALEIACDAL
jgi:D-alanyl-D-alanine carboxypeptidase